MAGHFIVCGDDALGIRIVDELTNAGARVASVQSPDDLAAAGVADAQAVICADDDDDLNLEIALLARQANPTVWWPGSPTASFERPWRRTTGPAQSWT